MGVGSIILGYDCETEKIQGKFAARFAQERKARKEIPFEHLALFAVLNSRHNRLLPGGIRGSLRRSDDSGEVAAAAFAGEGGGAEVSVLRQRQPAGKGS